jgi:predicted transposase YbfD/YdcC
MRMGLRGDAPPLGDAVRADWGIENSVQRVFDIAFHQDESRVCQSHADQNQAVLHRLALNLLREEPIAMMPIMAKRLQAGWDHACLI